jgi:hypothetical protein
MAQSAGKSVQKTLAAVFSAQQATRVAAAAGWAARIRKPVLLKTASCPGRASLPRRATHRKYSLGLRPMQCDCCAPSPARLAVLAPYAKAGCALQPQSCEAHRCAHNNARNGPRAGTRTGGDIFQQSREAGTGTPHGNHIPGNEIPSGKGSSRVEWVTTRPYLLRMFEPRLP